MEFESYFHGFSLNAVDAKGRVSLPANFRTVVERRVAPTIDPSQFPPSLREVMIGPHEELDCLVGFDSTYSRQLAAFLRERVEADGGDKLKAWDRHGTDAFGSANPASYDDAGRMVLTSFNRDFVGIGGLAYFVGAGGTFQIWDPERFRAANAENPRLLRFLDMQLKQREKREEGRA